MAGFKKTAFVVRIVDDLHDESNAAIHLSWSTIERDIRLAAQMIGAEFWYLDQVSFGRRPEYEYKLYYHNMSEAPALIYEIQELPLVK